MPWSGTIYGGGYDPNTKPIPWGPSNWSYAPDAAAKKLSLDAAGNVSNYSIPGSDMWNLGINRPPSSILQTNPDGSYALTNGSTFAQSKPPTAATLPFPHPGVGVGQQGQINMPFKPNTSGVVGGQNNNFMTMLMQWLKRLGGIQNKGNEIPYRGW